MTRKCLLMGLFAIVQPAMADSGAPDRPFGSGDSVLGFLSAAGGMVAGGFVGAVAGGLLDQSECAEDAHVCLAGTGGLILGGALGAIVGSAAGVTVYGAAADVDGSFGGALAGTLLGGLGGALAAGGLCVAGGEACVLGAALAVASPAVGATIGYALSGDDAPARDAGALLDYAPEGGLRVGTPAVAVGRAGGELRYGMTIIGGRF